MTLSQPAGAPASRRRRRSAGVVAVSLAVAVAGLGAVAPAASSAPTSECPDVYPTADLTGAEGMRVHGLTVDNGTVPEDFTGELLGVINDGIAPGLPMIVARLDSPAIEAAGGIWQGMSGSPVYAPDGRIIGAVSYGLAWGPSPVAGITPSEEMYRLLTQQTAGSARTLAKAAEGEDVVIPRTLQREMVSSGAAESEEADAGMSRLPLPLGISGLTQNRMKMAKKSLGLKGVTVYRAGSASSGLDPSEPLVAGGNLAASLSYGDVSAIGVGTTTAVCGNEVLAFGHPMLFSGPSKMSMHNAKAIYVQEDPAYAPFKVANATAPLGAVRQDRLAAIFGIESDTAIPATSTIASDVSVPADPRSRARHGETYVSVQDLLPDLAATHLLANQDRVFDAITGGSSRIAWSFDIKRENGTITKFSRVDKWANQWDISYEPTWDLFSQLYQIQNNGAEKVTFSNVKANSVMDRVFKAYQIAKVSYLKKGRWVRVPTDRPLRIRAGTVKRFNVTLTSENLPKLYFRIDVPIPDNTGRKYGVIEVLGGNSYWSDFEFFYGDGGGSEVADLDKLLTRLKNTPRNDHVLATLRLFTRRDHMIRRQVRKIAPAVVDGGVSFQVRGVLRKR